MVSYERQIFLGNIDLSSRWSSLVGLLILLSYILASDSARASQQSILLNPTGTMKFEGSWYYTDGESFQFDINQPLEEQFDTTVEVPDYAQAHTTNNHFYARVISFDGWEQAQVFNPAIKIRHNGNSTAIAIYDATGSIVSATSEEVGDQRLRNRPSFQDHTLEFHGTPPFMVVVHIANQFHGQPGWWWPVEIGPLKEIQKANQSSDGLSFFNLGILIIIGIYHIVLYFQRRRDSGALYFALFCLNLGVREFLVQKHLLLF